MTKNKDEKQEDVYNIARCSSYCTGEYYKLDKIASHLKGINIQHELYYVEVLYAKFPLEEETLGHNYCDVLIFQYGCVVFWGATQYDERIVLNKLSKYTQSQLDYQINDLCYYETAEGEDTIIDEESDLITLSSDSIMLKVSISYGLSQSVKLSAFENLVDRTIKATKDIPEQIMERGYIKMSKKVLAKKMGELFFVKNLINLHSVILDTPEFFWRKPKYEPYYNMAIKFLDTHTRLDILNKRIDVIHELYIMLSNEQQHLHSSRLELIIIFLIMIEILLALFRDHL